jgi:hypothetical protein
LFRTLCDGPINGQHLMHDADQSVEHGLNCVAAVDGDVAVQDFLENLRAGNQALALVTTFSSKPDTLTAPWKCATLKGTLGRFVDGKVPRGPHNFLAYQRRRMRRRRGRG